MSTFGAVLFFLGVAFVAYVYAGYPLLLEWASRRSRAASGGEDARRPWTPRSITMIIAAYDEEASIATKLENALSLDRGSAELEVIVAAHGSQDRTAQIARSFASRGVVTLHEPERRGKAAAIASAAGVAHGDVLVFSDANNVYARDALVELVRPMADPSVGVVSGAKRIYAGAESLGAAEGLYWRYESRMRENESRLGSTVAVVGEILAVRRSLFRPPPVGTINDDLWIALEMLSRGYRVVYAPKAHSWEHVSPTLVDEGVRRSRIVAGRLRVLASLRRKLPWDRPSLMWRLVSHKVMRPLVPIALVAMLVGNALWLLGGTWPARAFLLTQAIGVTLALLGPSRVLPGTLGKVAYTAGFVLHSNLAALKGMVDVALRRTDARWRRVRRRDETGTPR